jgi:hypothetical protein
MTDIWHGELMKHLKEKKKLFTQVSDIALGLTGDGVPLFKSFNWGKMACFPLMITNFNLPPEERNKAENVLLLGVIPGPSEPKLMNTFLYPLVQELLLLETGIDNVWDGYVKQDIKLKAHLVLVGGDMPAREKFMRHMGSGANKYCIYCKAQGVSNNKVYCPMTIPKDAPDKALSKHLW